MHKMNLLSLAQKIHMIDLFELDVKMLDLSKMFRITPQVVLQFLCPAVYTTVQIISIPQKWNVYEKILDISEAILDILNIPFEIRISSLHPTVLFFLSQRFPACCRTFSVV